MSVYKSEKSLHANVIITCATDVLFAISKPD